MSQEIITGIGSIQKIENLLQKHGNREPFVIAGEHLQKEEKSLLPFAHKLWRKNAANVSQEEIEECFIAYKASGAQAVVAIGGGSVIDLAKAVLNETINKELPLPYFICAPTTAGSGSEATRFAVIYRNKVKASLDAAALLPQTVILDPQLTYTLSSYQTAVSGIDALSQAVESYWNIHATPESQAFATDAIRLLPGYLPSAVTKPTPANREKMLWAAHLAGKAINITRTTGPHALSYYLTAYHDVPHGQAVAFFLPVFFLYNSSVNEENTAHAGGTGRVTTTMSALCRLLNVKDTVEAAGYIQQLMKNTGLAVQLKELGIDKHAVIDPLLDSISAQRFNNNPVALDKEVLKKLCIEYL